MTTSARCYCDCGRCCRYYYINQLTPASSRYTAPVVAQKVEDPTAAQIEDLRAEFLGKVRQSFETGKSIYRDAAGKSWAHKKLNIE